MFFMTKHIVDAIVLNIKRTFPYAKVSNGLSLPVSLTLIFSELLTVPTALIFDLWARRYQRFGFTLLEEEFVDMELAPSFRQETSKRPRSFQLFKVPLRRLFNSAIRCDWKKFIEVLEVSFNEIKHSGACTSMLLHVVESALRCAYYANVNESRFRKAGIKTPKALYRSLLIAHLSAIPTSSVLDLLAYPVQRRGVPILDQDLPPVWPV